MYVLKAVALAAAVWPQGAAATHMGAGLAEYEGHWIGYLCIGVFAGSLLLAAAEELTGLRKSKPMVVSAGLIWALVGWLANAGGASEEAAAAVRHSLLQYTELMIFLLVAMTYINAMSERRLFEALRGWIAARGLSFRRLFWVSGLAAFCLSPVLDNLTVAMLMGAILLACAAEHRLFVSVAFANLVVAVNAGGVFSPFGDLTTLMVWQRDIHTPEGTLGLSSLSRLAAPALVAFLVPAAILSRAVPAGGPCRDGEPVAPRRGAWVIVGLFLATIATAVLFQSLLHLPGAVGMATGLSYLQFFGYYLKTTHSAEEVGVPDEERMGGPVPLEGAAPFDVFNRIARVEWDALFFLYGVALSVAGLAYLGYLSTASEVLYAHWGQLAGNVAVGLLSSVIENIPAMFMVLAMSPDMSLGHWLLVTLAVGTGGSILCIGSAAGVALMGQSGGAYTFLSHLRWAPAILLGYFAGVLTHLGLAAPLT